jgi:hypothetical protein
MRLSCRTSQPDARARVSLTGNGYDNQWKAVDTLLSVLPIWLSYERRSDDNGRG